MKRNKGFTLIELLVVVAIIAILAIVVLVALKPAQRLADTRDARRGQDLNQILTAIHSCIVDNDTSTYSTCVGAHTAGQTYELVTGSTTTGCDDVCTGVTSDTHCMNIETTLDDYFIQIPKDPGTVASGHTEYQATVYANGMVVLEACSAEGGPILVSR